MCISRPPTQPTTQGEGTRLLFYSSRSSLDSKSARIRSFPTCLLLGLPLEFAAQSLTSAIEVDVSTIFVGLAEDPHILQQRNPFLFDMIAVEYPQVTRGVHGSV